MADYKNNVSEKKGKVIYNIGIVKGIVRLAVEDVSGVAIQYKKRTVKRVRTALRSTVQTDLSTLPFRWTCITVTAFPTSLTISSET